MALFKSHYRDIGKDDHPVTWPGTVFQCKVMVLKPGVFFLFCCGAEVFFSCSGKSAPEECGVKVPAKAFNTSGLKQHIRDKHVEEYRATIQRAGDISVFFPGSVNAVRRENITLAFADNALPYQVF